jgi:hypothetical protein
MRLSLLITALTSALLCPAGVVAATDQGPTQPKTQPKTQQQVDVVTKKGMYGKDLMTAEENAEYRARLQAAKTAEERDTIRSEHHELMQERAKERGVTLLDRPPKKGNKGVSRANRGAKANKSMTAEEKNEYHARLQAAKTAEERDMVRKEYEELMQERARKQGMTPPQQPPQQGAAP